MSGINSTTAKNIVKYREENGKYTERKQLLKVPKLGKVAFEQCAGFLRIMKKYEHLKNQNDSWYWLYKKYWRKLLKAPEKLGHKKEDLLDKKQLVEIRNKLTKINIKDMAKELEIGEITLEDIIKELSKPGRDVRDDMPKPILRSDVLKFEDLRIDQILTGTVRNVTDFGAFVDIGVKHDGLVHISQLSDKFVKNPSDVVSIGDIVKVKVIDIDTEKQKVKLTMKGIN